ncbi:Hypothetical protein ROUS_66 [Brevibacterium phage Rousseau]|nr:Hypothetical protein ROUS_66 [Brevibacterium phage Rousseau]
MVTTGLNMLSGGTVMSRMLGRTHEPHCDCNIEWAVSGAGEKRNHRYGNKRQRAAEKRELRQALNDE